MSTTVDRLKARIKSMLREGEPRRDSAGSAADQIEIPALRERLGRAAGALAHVEQLARQPDASGVLGDLVGELAACREGLVEADDAIASRYMHVAPSATHVTQPGGMPAVLVPLDYPEVVPSLLPTAPYDFFVSEMERELPGFQKVAEALAPYLALEDVPDDPPDATTPHWNQTYLSRTDASVLYAMLRLRAPARLVEIGSGNSTKFARKAIRDGDLPTHITSIDPMPRAEIDAISDEIHRRSLCEMPDAFFDDLSEGDFVFLDGSHLAIQGTDVPHFFLRVLPRLPDGVVVHVHDIALPDEYPDEFVERRYGEQYVLGAFLLDNARWSVLAPVHFMTRRGILPGFGGSFWMERIPPGHS